MDLIEVRNLLSQCGSILSITESNVKDYPSFRQAVFKMELEQEIEHLNECLNDPDTFIEQFKARCASRELDKNSSISFADAPSSLTNQLFWEIATHLFQPKTMQEMLVILMPGIEQHLRVKIPKKLPVSFQRSELRNHLKTIEPVLVLTDNLDALNQPPDINELSHYVFSGKVLFSVHNIANFTLRMHHKAQFLLQKNHPELAEKLYLHNAEWHTLQSDLFNFQRSGMTPKEAIEQLIMGLTLGGERVSGAVYAGKISEQAVERFFNYFDALPKQLRDQLLGLEGSISLEDIFEQYIAKGNCVEETAVHLTTLLHQNSQHEFLCSSPGMPSEFLKQLEGKYKANNAGDHLLSVLKDLGYQTKLPDKLIKKALQVMDKIEGEELVVFMMNIPLSLYDGVMKYNKLRGIPLARSLYRLADAIKIAMFNQQQKIHLARVLASHTELFPYERMVLHWAAYTNDLDCFNEVLHALTAEQIQFQSSTIDIHRRNLLHITAMNSELLKSVLVLYPNKQDLKELLLEYDTSGQTVLHYAAQDSNSILLLLNLFPKRERQAMVMLENEMEQSLLHRSIANADALQTLLSYFPSKEHRINALMKKDEDGKTCLHLAANHPQSLLVILKLFTDHTRNYYVKKSDVEGNTVLHLANKNVTSLRLILSQLDKSERFRAVNYKNKQGDTVLDALQKVQSIIVVLGALSETEQLQVLRHKNKSIGYFWQKLLGQGELLVQEDELLKDTFLLTYLSIRSYLLNQEMQSRTCSFFSAAKYIIPSRASHPSQASQLITKITALDSFDEIKDYLHEFMEKNPESALTEGLAERLGVEAMATRLNRNDQPC